MCLTTKQFKSQIDIKMKLLEWMHQKLRKKSPETFRDFTTGKPSLADQVYPVKPSFGSRFCTESLKQLERDYIKSFSEFEANRLEKTFEDETSLVVSENFHGFLSIGTFGSEPVINEPETPTFKISLGETTNNKKGVTENDLKLINYELEKFLDAEAKEEGSHEASARNSQVSIITLSGKETEGVTGDDYEKLVICPLQGYLFGPTVQLPNKTITQVKKEKASLAELFQRTKIFDESPEDAEIQKKKLQKSSIHLMKRMGKKPNASTNCFSYSTGGISATKNKLKKVLRILHRKIHPESCVAAGEFDKSNRNKGLQNCPCSCMHPDEDNNQPQYKVNGSAKSYKREHWIKTDAEYLVLEL